MVSSIGDSSLRSDAKVELVFLVFTILSLVFYYFSLLYVSGILNIFSFCFLSIVSLYVLFSRQGFVYSFYLFSLGSAMMATLMAESLQVSFIEVGKVAEFSGATSRLCFLSALFISLVAFFGRRFGVVLSIGKSKDLDIKFAAFLIFFIVFSYALLVYSFLDRGAPLFLGISRFDYINERSPFFYRRIYTLIPFFVFSISLMHSYRYIRRRLCYILTFSAFLLLLLGGEKFSLYLVSIFFYFLPKYLFSGKQVRLSDFFGFILIFFFVFSITMLVYLNTTGSLSILLPRIALQGQMPYMLDSISNFWPTNSSQVLTGFLGVGAENPYDYGMYFLMGLISPQEVFLRMIEAGITFTAPFPGSFIYFFGYILAPLAIFVFSILIGFSHGLLVNAISGNKFFLSFVSLLIYFNFYLALLMGKSEKFFDVVSVFLLVLVFLFAYFRVQFKK